MGDIPCSNIVTFTNKNGLRVCDYHKLLVDAFTWENRNERSWEPTPKRKGLWQLEKYGGDCIMMRDRCRADNCKECRKSDARWFGWKIPARTVKIAGSTINFNAGCNLYRAKMLRDIVKAQKSKAKPTYKPQVWSHGQNYDGYSEFELLVGGKTILARGNGNGAYKRGEVKDVMKRNKLGGLVAQLPGKAH